MSILEIAQVLVEHSGLQAKTAEQFVSAFFDVVQDGLESDGQVKVKGLGTFKIIDVGARESVDVNTGERIVIEGRGKITFTPDAAMKEMVNKPFSLFETTVLNDGVTFDDMTESTDEAPQPDKDDEAFADEEPTPTVEEAPVQAEAPAAEEPPVPEEAPEEEVAPAEEVEETAPMAALASSVEEEPPVEEETPPAVEEEEPPVEEETPPAEEKEEPPVEEETPPAEEEEEPAEEEEEPVEEEEEEPQRRTWLWVLLALLVVALGLGGGYYWSKRSAAPAAELVVAELPDTAATQVDSVATAAATDTTATQAAPTPAPATPPVAQATDEEDWKKYEQMDARVRTGAYHIIGLDRVVKARAGQTVKAISARTLGPDMECYVEVYNGLKGNTVLEAGQEVKIPKLKPKRKFRKPAAATEEAPPQQ